MSELTDLFCCLRQNTHEPPVNSIGPLRVYRVRRPMTPPEGFQDIFELAVAPSLRLLTGSLRQDRVPPIHLDPNLIRTKKFQPFGSSTDSTLVYVTN